MSLKNKYFNNFLTKIKIKKKFKKLFNNQIKKIINKKLILKKIKTFNKYYFVKYIINISFKKSNVFLHILNSCGKEKYFYSSKKLLNNTKNLKFNTQVLEKFYKTIILEFKYLKNQPIALHLNSIEFNYQWFIEKIFAKFFLIIVKFYNNYPYNGCRKKKLKRKKHSSKRNG